MKIDRRQFMTTACYGVAALRLNGAPMNKTHIVTLSFDDGFRKSSYATAEIFERHKLRACINVIAIGHEWNKGVHPENDIDLQLKGDFDDWNKLKSRGHEVMAHTYDHTNLTEIPIDEAKKHIDRCAQEFETRLKGFKANESVYNFAYNASNKELDDYALKSFLVVRTQGDTAVNPIPTRRKPVRVGCFSFGPDNCDSFLDEQIEAFLKSEGGWFVFNTHGLDGEGWGPVSSKYLDSLLTRLVKMPHVDVLPAGQVVLRLPR